MVLRNNGSIRATLVLCPWQQAAGRCEASGTCHLTRVSQTLCPRTSCCRLAAQPVTMRGPRATPGPRCCAATAAIVSVPCSSCCQGSACYYPCAAANVQSAGACPEHSDALSSTSVSATSCGRTGRLLRCAAGGPAAGCASAQRPLRCPFQGCPHWCRAPRGRGRGYRDPFACTSH